MNRDIIFKNLEKIDIKQLKSKKKIEIYHALDIKNRYYSIFIINTKSRFLIKNANELINLQNSLVDFKNHNYKKKIALISSPLCSKAKKFLIENKWNIKIDFM